MKILAVSGGIDSVVMLHLLRDEPDVLVAHFDHGIRPNSAEDCEFVKKLSEKYGKPFVFERKDLGDNCSEATARQERYAFFEKLAKEHDGKIYVAHHADDIIESIAINILRGTGWRGLAPMQNTAVVRPLGDWSKAQIYRYATDNNLSFRQDQTNTEGDYLRNRVREALRFASKADKNQMLDLYKKQCGLEEQIDEILSAIIKQPRYSRQLAELDIAPELLRAILAHYEIRLTRPQLNNCVHAIREYAPGKRFSLDKDHFLVVERYSFLVEKPQK